MTKKETDRCIVYCFDLESDYEEGLASIGLSDMSAMINMLYHGKASEVTEEVAELVVDEKHVDTLMDGAEYRVDGYKCYQDDNENHYRALESLLSIIGDAEYVIIVKKG